MRKDAERLTKLTTELVSSVKRLKQSSQHELKEKLLEMERYEEAVIHELKKMELEKDVKELRTRMEGEAEGSGA